MQNLYRLANIMGLETKDPQHTALLKESMHGIVDPEEFLEYCRTQKDGIVYSNRVEKLDMLATRYKNTINNIPTELLQTFSKEITNKFKTAIQVLRDNEEYLTDDLSRLKVEGQQYFTNKELDLMNSTGKLNRLINLYELGTLYDALYAASVKKTLLAKKQASLTDGEKRIQKMIGESLR